MRVRGTKAHGSFSCDKDGAFELLVHMEADPQVISYTEFDFDSVLPSYRADQLSDVSAFLLNHRAGLFVVSAHSANLRRNHSFQSVWSEANDTLAKRDIWLFSTSPEKLRREPKWTRARELARCAHIDIDPRDQERVLDYLSHVRHASICTCAKLCNNSVDSLDALYKLISEGTLFLESDDVILPAGNVTLQPPEISDRRAAIGWIQPLSPVFVSRLQYWDRYRW